ncbi:hypothetical protein HPB47_019072 [Ixodes persulcatus]|uniref:Uncharacterized protein n=1 Tax=Ixodes persulcatus TaxID=34615 RepID=A0AC60QL26_IXOPE|nr:hypothetical protein HPB47_019072 [Ixodes persulcatus]
MEDPLDGSTVDVAKNGGPTVVSMVGEDVDPDFCEGWMRARARGGTQVEKEPRPSSYVARKVIEKVERMGRMPRVGLEGENKVVVRPRGGLDLRKTTIVVVAAAIRAAAGISEEEASLDTQCPNVQQNVVVISTGSDARAVRYAAVTCICVAGRSYEVRAYVTAPFDTVKGVIRGVPVHHTAEEIERLLIGPRNPTVRAAERIGSSATVVVIFGGDVVPHQVFYGGSVLRCSLYRKHYEVCKTCGHGAWDVAELRTRDMRVVPDVASVGVCKNRFRTPYIVRRRLWERAERGLSGDRPSPPPRGSEEEYPRLGRSRSRSRESERPAARSRSRSTSGQVSWAQAVQSDRGEVAKLREENRRQAAEVVELRRENKKLVKTVEELKALVEGLVRRLDSSAPPSGPEDSAPPAKRRSVEARRRRGEGVEDRFEEIEGRVGLVEDGVTQLNEKMDSIMKGDENVERVLTEVLVGRLGVCLCNVYSNPRFGRQRARELLGRAFGGAAEYSPSGFGEVLRTRREDRRVFPPPHGDLVREDAVLLRQLQVECVFTPVVGRYVAPEVYSSDKCVLCGARATAEHVLWDCETRPAEAATSSGLPPDIKAGVMASSLDLQVAVVQQARRLLRRQVRPRIPCAGASDGVGRTG